MRTRLQVREQGTLRKTYLRSYIAGRLLFPDSDGRNITLGVLIAIALLTVFGSVKAIAQSSSTCTLDRATGTTIDPQPFMRNAWGSRWNVETNRIAYMQPNAEGYYRIFTVSPDGRDRLALTEGQPRLPPNKHQGMLYWHPSGRYLMFAAQKPDWTGRTLFGPPDYEALPGFGRHDDLWLITVDGKRLWQLINEPNTKRQEGSRTAMSKRRQFRFLRCRIR